MINLEFFFVFLLVIRNQYFKGSLITENGSSLRAGMMERLFEDINLKTFELKMNLR